MHPAVERINIPILYQASSAFNAFNIGYDYFTYLPMYVIIDKQGVVRMRSDWINFDNATDLIDELLNE